MFMPEGDTIFRAARTLRQALAGREVLRVATNVPQVRLLGPNRLVGQTVADVESRGKHLLCWFQPSDLALHTHMMMRGSWHVYRPAQRWRKSERAARIVLDVPGWTAVCFNAPVCELLSRAQVDAHPVLARLGPDALDEEPDLVQARRRLDLRPEVSIGEALLDQRVLAGIGNVFKSEVLFIHRVDPWARVGELPDEVRDALLATAVRLLQANAAAGAPPRRTTNGRAGNRLYVYGRTGRACPACGAVIRSALQGTQARRTFWCPGCQAGPTPRQGTAG